MAEQITAFKASDGKLFPSLQEALEWEDERVWAEKIKMFFASGTAPYAEGTYSSMTRKVIIAWEKFKAVQPDKLTKESSIEQLDLTIRSKNCLKADNIYTIGVLVSRTENELIRTPNLGRKALAEVKEKLAMHGFMLSV